MKVLKTAVCTLAAFALAALLAACGNNDGTAADYGETSGINVISDVKDQNGSSIELPEEEFTAQAVTVAEKFFAQAGENRNIAYTAAEKIDSSEYYVYAVTDKENTELGRIAVNKTKIDDVLLCSAESTFTSYKTDIADMPESEVKNSNGDRMILNVMDNCIYVYDVDGDTAQLTQIIAIDDTTGVEYTNDRLSAINFNFDDYTDIAVLKGEDPLSLSTSYSDYYLYDDTVNRFVKNDSLSQIPNIGVDGGENTLSSYTHISAYENQEVTYSWVDGELIPIKKTAQTYNEDEQLYYITEYEYDENLNEVQVSNESYTQQELEALQS